MKTARVSMTLGQWGRNECALLVHLSNQERDLLATLLGYHPGLARTCNQLIEAMWPDADLEPDTAWKCIHLLIFRLREKGIPIGMERGRGYFIDRKSRGA